MLPWDGLVSSSKTPLLSFCIHLSLEEVSLLPFHSHLCGSERYSPAEELPHCLASGGPCITNHILMFINTKGNCRGWMNNSSTFSKSSHTRK